MLILIAAAVVSISSASTFTQVSSTGRWRITLAPKSQPVPLHLAAPWTLELEAAHPPAAAPDQIGIAAQGPGHARAPQLRRILGRLRFAVENLAFDAPGQWNLSVLVRDAAGWDQAQFRVTAGRAEPAPVSFSDAEIRLMRTLSLESLDPPPAVRPAEAELGRRLFFDTALSRAGETSCATCHDPNWVYSGAGPSLLALADTAARYRDGRHDSLWSKAAAEMEEEARSGSSPALALGRLRENQRYRDAYVPLFGEPSDGRTILGNLGRALAAFLATLRPQPGRFDTFVAALVLRQDIEASRLLDAAEVRGLRLLLDSGNRCLSCHSGPLLSDREWKPVAEAAGFRYVHTPSLRFAAYTAAGRNLLPHYRKIAPLSETDAADLAAFFGTLAPPPPPRPSQIPLNGPYQRFLIALR